MRNMIVTMAMLAFLCLVSCEEDPCRPKGCTRPPISVLRVSVLDGFAYANLMPVIPPDPIFCELTLRIENTSSEYSYSGISVPSASVYLVAGNELLGEFEFTTDWEGSIRPEEVDTIVVTKVQESSELFTPPCGEEIYLDILITAGEYGELLKRTRVLYFMCVY